MCGIAGAFAFDPAAGPVDSGLVAALNERQRRRGPDGEGLWQSQDGRLVLGHRRLAIVDIGTDGRQPMADVSGRWTISFNGEIYNYRALRAELEGLGRRFATNSDTEVLINSVAQWGEAGLRRLRGMYAFALWDALEQELWLARDPYGIKPLYVSENKGTLWFASQARALADCAPVDARRDAAALTGFYLWGHVPEPFSWWTGVQMFPAGYYQRVKPGRNLGSPAAFRCVEDCYISAPARPFERGELRGLIADSIRHHMEADVPVGVFLSAGIDSNVIAALASETGRKVKTVTLAFAEYAGTPHDEAPLAEAAARGLGTDHVTVRITQDAFESILDDFLESMDQPSIDGLNTYLISRAAAMQGLKAVLSGLGGDELFGGYPSFHQIPKLLSAGRFVSPLPKFLIRAMERMLRAAPRGLPPKASGLLSHSTDITRAYLLRRALHLEGDLADILDESRVREGLGRLSTIAAIDRSIAPLRQAGASVHAQIAALESCWYMRNQLLRDADWASMAHGLEVRVPFVDFTLLESLGPAIASTTPPGKQDLAACAGQLPADIRSRPKTGFTTPIRTWIGAHHGASARGLRGWAADVHRSFRFIPRAPLSAGLPAV